MKTGIIIPCYNEEKRIQSEVFLQFVQTHTDYHLCFVNDGSKDKTLKVLKRMQFNAPDDISIIDVKKNKGKAAAVRAGARYLYHRKDISFIGFMDADLSTDFDDFKDLVDKLKSNDGLSMVFGSRNSGGQGIERNNFRSIMSTLVRTCVSSILQLPIRDTQCGAKVFVKSIIPVVYGKEFKSRWLFDVEIFLRLKDYLGVKHVMNHIKEQPLMRWVHVDDSKLGLRDSIQIPLKLMGIWFAYKGQPSFTNTISLFPNDPSVEIIEVPQLRIAA